MGWNPNMGPASPRPTGAGAFRLLLTLGWLAVIGTAFVLGYQLAYYDADNALIEVQRLKAQSRELREQLLVGEEQIARLESARVIDREARRLAQAQLEELQHERHEFAKQVSVLERLIREGGGGVVQVQDFELWETDMPGQFGYRFTVSQLIPEFGQTSGQVQLRLAGKTAEGETFSHTAAQLEGSEPRFHRMQFEYFQHFTGLLRLPNEWYPETLTVEIEPNVKNLISSSRAYAWKPEPAWVPHLAQPEVMESAEVIPDNGVAVP